MGARMINIDLLEKDYGVFYNPVEGYKYLYLGRKNDPNETLRIFPFISLKEALKIAKDNDTTIRNAIPLDKEDEPDLRDVCDKLNSLI